MFNAELVKEILGQILIATGLLSPLRPSGTA